MANAQWLPAKHPFAINRSKQEALQMSISFSCIEYRASYILTFVQFVCTATASNVVFVFKTSFVDVRITLPHFGLICAFNSCLIMMMVVIMIIIINSNYYDPRSESDIVFSLCDVTRTTVTILRDNNCQSCLLLFG